MCNFLKLRSCDFSICSEYVIFCFDLTKPTKFRHHSSISKSPSAPLFGENFPQKSHLSSVFLKAVCGPCLLFQRPETRPPRVYCAMKMLRAGAVDRLSVKSVLSDGSAFCLKFCSKKIRATFSRRFPKRHNRLSFRDFKDRPLIPRPINY